MSDIHKHLLVDAEFYSTPTDTQQVEDWCNRLVKAIDMELFIPPIAKYCDDAGNEGLSFFGMITTSHFSGHFWEKKDQPFAKFDLYSCKHFDASVFLELLEEFGPKKVNYVLIDRSNGKFKKVEGKTIQYDQ